MAYTSDPNPDRTDEEIADLVLDRLSEFSPALSIERGEEDWQVVIHITMARSAIDEGE